MQQLIDAGSRSGRQDVRLTARVLASSLDDVTALLHDGFVSAGDDPGAVLDAYRADHHRRQRE